MNIVEISERFPSELDCVEYFEAVRWPDSPVCPFCYSTSTGKRNKDFRWHCKLCSRSFSVTTGTNLHNTRLPLKTWMLAFAIISDGKKGISAMQLQRNLGIHYETAWNMRNKIRELMANITSNDDMFETLVKYSMYEIKHAK